MFLKDREARDHPDDEEPELKAPHQTNRFHVVAAKFPTACIEGFTLLTDNRNGVYEIGSR